MKAATPPPAVRNRPEGLLTAMLLAGVGGFLDAYTFVGYGGVFANAQTGNIVLFGVDAQAGHWRQAALHVPPVAAFMLGVAFAQTFAQPAVRAVVRRPTRWVLAAVAARPGWVPQQVVPSVIAFAAAVQVTTFRSLEGVGYSSTLTTSNLRTLTTSIYEWLGRRDGDSRHKAALLAWVVAAFAAGAGAGAVCTRLVHQRAAWFPAAVLALVLAVLVIETTRLDRRTQAQLLT